MKVQLPWGKCDVEAGRSHHLAHHCMDVAACFEALTQRTAFRTRLEKAASRSLHDTDLARLALLVFWHDIGKIAPGFQAKAFPGKWEARRRTGHLAPALDLFSTSLEAAKPLRLEQVCQWIERPSLVAAVVSHHGRPLRLTEKRPETIAPDWRADFDYDPCAAAAEIGGLPAKWFPQAFSKDLTPLPDSPAFEHFLCGLATLADWIGSDEERFPFRASLDLDYASEARSRASSAIDALGFDVSRLRAVRTARATFREVSGFETPNAQQAAVGALDLNAPLAILEAETGSGKTEAALWRYAQLFEAGRVDALYFAVPTRAAAVQLHRRVAKASKRLFGEVDPEPVLAVPGYLRAGDADGRALPDWRTLWDDGADEAAIARRWAAESARRYLAAAIAVGTVDQAMLGTLQVKHAHLRAASLSRALLVIDEVHASDAYMTAVLKRLLDAHLATGGHAFLMSATLGSCARSAWLADKERPRLNEAIAAPYPAIWRRGCASPIGIARNVVPRKDVEMHLEPTMSADAAAEKALAAAAKGARVLVIRNTVDAATQTLRAIESTDATAPVLEVNGVRTLHHSRFAPSDRMRLDAAVEEALAPCAKREAEGRIVVGTQTLEQSLDIDADFLITDLCPIDVLLQRIGRLHRHHLPRPSAFMEPSCQVLTPDDGLDRLTAPRFENGLGAWKGPTGVIEGVYIDLAVVELTRRLVVREPVWRIPEMNRFLVESATHPDAIEVLLVEKGEPWRAYRCDLYGNNLAAGGVALLHTIDRTRRFGEQLFPGEEESIRTRLGADGIRLSFEAATAGPFGEMVDEIILPSHMSRFISSDEQPVVLDSSPEHLRFIVGEEVFAYDRCGLSRAR